MKIQELYSLFLKSVSVSIDSRTTQPGAIFFPLKGENSNGNEYIEKALESGARYAITDQKEREDPKRNIHYVEDSLTALQELAKYHRIKMNIPIISLTGSNGKTTTKELLSAVLSKKYRLTATKGNLNNHIGVPLTLLTIKAKHELAIIEMGANHQKEIEFLCGIALPDFGYITNFGKAHLEGFGGVEGVIKGKSEMYRYLAANSKTAFVNCNDPIQMELTADLERITFGSCDEPDFKFGYIENQQGRCPEINYRKHSFQSSLVGAYNAPNVAAAVAFGLYFKVPQQKITEAISEYDSGDNRSEIIQKENLKIVLDAYNANPSSMEAALLNFERMEGSKTVVLGDMFELGETSQSEHQKIADLASTLNIDQIFLIGEHFSQIKNSNPKITLFQNRDSSKLYFEKNKISTQLLLLKGSRGMALEKLLPIF